MLLRAVEEGMLATEKNPFNRIKLHEGKAWVKAKLSDAEVARFEALPAERMSAGQLLARDTCLLQYYLLGSRIGDVLTLRWRDVRSQEVEFTEHKTGKQKLAPHHEALDAGMILLSPGVQGSIIDAGDFWGLVGFLLIPVVGWLGLRCWSAYIGQRVEQRGAEAGQQQASAALNDRLVQLALGLVLLVCVWLLSRPR